jgi:uncharacterized MAPEG superfamily protein
VCVGVWCVVCVCVYVCVCVRYALARGREAASARASAQRSASAEESPAGRRATGHTCPRWAAHSLAAGAGAPRQAEPHLQVPNQIHVNINIDISI